LPYDFLYDLSRLPRAFFKELVRVAYSSKLHRKAGTIAKSLVSIFKIEKITGLNINNAKAYFDPSILPTSEQMLRRLPHKQSVTNRT